MSTLNNILASITANLHHGSIALSSIVAMLIVVTALSAYEYLVYRFVSHRAFYNKSFHISLSVLPFFLASILMCLQSSLVITLGTIGALAIIRYRTSIKDPTDMVYLLWSVFIGIICGCQLYEVAALTSVVVTVVLFVLEHINLAGKPLVVILHLKDTDEAALDKALKTCTKKYRIKSRNYTSTGIDYALEVSAKDPKAVMDTLKRLELVDRLSVIEYDMEDIV